MQSVKLVTLSQYRGGKAKPINDVYVDKNRVIYAIDRMIGGVYIMELTL